MIQLMERISHAWRDERPASASVPEQTNPCTAQNRHLPLSTAGAGRDGGTKDRETRTSKTGKHGTTERTAGKPATDAGQTGLPTHQREQNQLAGAGGQMGREA